MTREALVKEVRDGKALVCPVDTGECDSCEARNACHTLSGGKDRKVMSFWTENAAGASRGDIVSLELKPSASLTIITVTFLVPVLLLFAGYLFMSGGTDGERAAGSAAGLILGIVMAVVANRRMGAHKSFNMRIVSILEKAEGKPMPETIPESRMEGWTP
ncbi:MAG: SoxR reducing system RseC family protein [Candidatus Fermentibacteraceae bacterium]|nr:SoxR reducing system RseC family protein [Candidatus Fermentibacteraceae bacterium]MBN2608296.1 SoxR reducing system RseC family protein [Candidatus Fermentibacteraceae bacterium]